MFVRDLTEKIMQQRKTIVNGPLGQTETWNDVREFWASVLDVSGNTVGSWPKLRGKEGTKMIYRIKARNLGLDWAFKDTRFLWTPAHFGKTLTLKPIKTMIRPGKEARHWGIIMCEDITGYSVVCE